MKKNQKKEIVFKIKEFVFKLENNEQNDKKKSS